MTPPVEAGKKYGWQPHILAPHVGCLWLLLALASCGEPSSTPKRIVLVTIDTLRADHVGCYGADWAQTPTLDAIASDGVRFAHAIAPTPLTLPSHTTLLTGLDPPRHGVRDNSVFRLEAEVPTLAERLRAGGYATAAFVGALVLDSEHGLDRGFDHYGDFMGVATSDRSTAHFPARRAASVVDEALAWLEEEAPGRFFLWVHLFDPHAEYAPPEPHRSAFPGSPYDAEIAYSDAELGRLLAEVDARFGAADTLVVATSDHGESLGEHGELTHGLTIYDATQRVPLVLKGPGVPAGRVVESVVRLADVAPTVLALAGLPALPSGSGADLRPLWSDGEAPPRTAYVETLAPQLLFGWSPLLGIRSDAHKYIRAPRPELYALHRDPGEKQDLLQDSDAPTLEIAQQLDAEIARAQEQSRPIRPGLRPSREKREQLRALGYLVTEPANADGSLGVVGGIDPKDEMAAVTRYFRAAQLRAEGRDAEALALLDDTEGRGGVVFDLLRARVLISLGEYARAEALAREILGRGDRVGAQRLSAALMALGHSLFARRRLAEAEPAFAQAALLNPVRASPLLMLAALELERGAPEEAEPLYRRALATPDGSLAARVLLAALLLEQGRSSEADAVLAQIPPAARPGVMETVRLARAEAAAGRGEQALRRLDEAAQSLPESAALAFARSELLRTQRGPARAIAEHERALALEPDSALAQNNLAWLLAEARKPQDSLDRALSLSLRAVGQSGEDANFLDTLATIHLQRGAFAEAESAAARGLVSARGPGRAHLLYVRAEAAKGRGERALSAAALEEALALLEGMTPTPWLRRAVELAEALELEIPGRLHAIVQPSLANEL